MSNNNIIDGANGYSFQVIQKAYDYPGIYIGIKEPGNNYYKEINCWKIVSKQFEYDLNSKRLLYYYLCNDGKTRSKTYYFKSSDDLQQFINMLKEAYDIRLKKGCSSSLLVPIVNITKIPGQKTPRGINGDSKMIGLIAAGIMAAIFLIAIVLALI